MIRATSTHKAGSRRGMTLPELMIATSICSVIAIATIGTYVASVRGTAKSIRYNKSMQEARIIGDTIAKDLRAAQGWDPTGMFFDGETTHTGEGTLILDLPRVDAQGLVVDMNPPFDKVIYERDENNSKILYRRVFPAEGSSRRQESRQYGDAVQTARFWFAWAGIPNAQRRTFIYYEFMIERELLGKTYRTPVSGFVQMRNKRPGNNGS